MKVYDSFLGNNNAILYNSNHYKIVLYLGAFLAVLTILFNLWLIPEYGIDGAAYATFLALFIYNTLKIIYVKQKFHILPFTVATWKVLLLFLTTGGGFYFFDFPFHPILSILLKSAVITGVVIFVLYRFKFSDDINGLIDKLLKRIK